MSVASQLCDERLTREIFDLLSESDPDSYPDSKFIPTIIKLLPKFADTIVYCKFFDNWNNCSKFLFPVLTEEGLCYSFNKLRMSEMSTTE